MNSYLNLTIHSHIHLCINSYTFIHIFKHVHRRTFMRKIIRTFTDTFTRTLIHTIIDTFNNWFIHKPVYICLVEKEFLCRKGTFGAFQTCIPISSITKIPGVLRNSVCVGLHLNFTWDNTKSLPLENLWRAFKDLKSMGILRSCSDPQPTLVASLIQTDQVHSAFSLV